MIDDRFMEGLFGFKEDPVYNPVEKLFESCVLITGAGGFIGSRVAYEVSQYRPSKMILLDHNEFGLYEVHRKLCDRFPESKIVPVLGSYGDSQLIAKLLRVFQPTVVYHVGAYKHVPLVERNPVPAVYNNVIGADRLFYELVKKKVLNLVVVSSDKAVNPTNIMGATKRIVEMTALACQGAIENVQVVRFGNVLWSSGSVLPLFKSQLLNGDPVTLTDENVTRYFMSARQAVMLIMQSQFLGSGVFALDMGPPIKIKDIIESLADYLNVSSYKVRITGLRPGEKMYEELALGQGLVATDHPKIKKATDEHPLTALQLCRPMEKLAEAVKFQDPGGIRRVLQEAVPEYNPMCGIVDDVFLHENVFNWQFKFGDPYKDTESA